MPAEMEPLDVNSTARDVEDYLERCDIWCLTKSDMDDKKLTAYFLHFVGKEAYTLIKNLVYPESPIDISYNELKKKVLQHFKPINSVAAERARFNMLTRSHSQSVRDFVLQLQTQAAKCDYGAQLEDQLRDRLIAGIQLPELQQKLLLCPDQKFQTIRKISPFCFFAAMFPLFRAYVRFAYSSFTNVLLPARRCLQVGPSSTYSRASARTGKRTDRGSDSELLG
ncbi:hypothetical protein CLF_101702 [Clonorchis sinensis]|uniref:Retrotransposon gag domain-containing protein n=1 Tax=Clonorchis sinensis TaxID=79923 RepID=G7Y6D0_CLOSI|nr:hypothetical protein CLF_101702 [Clonorchis sinensis]